MAKEIKFRAQSGKGKARGSTSFNFGANATTFGTTAAPRRVQKPGTTRRTQSAAGGGS